MPHHGRLGPRKEEPESASQMVSYEGPITRSRAEFINLVHHLDNMKACVKFQKQLGLNLWPFAKVELN